VEDNYFKRMRNTGKTVKKHLFWAAVVLFTVMFAAEGCKSSKKTPKIDDKDRQKIEAEQKKFRQTFNE